ncbi:branched-chain amino acid transport system substrate-binding protein [Aminobacter lissarensis]|uniref:Branched-chain amino acid transport system substrate-binding protein n=1 Tax=Aminobacter carboxidus TaxID=376165 RepID=A0A8E1WGS5_9HYPH|nr:ABC transporter substrate-binding protein [Aminobacter lissarensis]MBB6468242.1 branched-chain amino acid transport system substrate-binding protein [Aminobacter lissarensis]
MTTPVTKLLLRTALLLGSVLPAPVRAAEDTLAIANMTFRTGPYAAAGTPLMDGQRDYMLMLNERDGGINGIKLNYDECETGFSVDKATECYDKAKASSLVTQPWSPAITLELLPKASADKVPVLAPGYGFSAISDGKHFPWAFNPPVSYWDGASMMLKGISGDDLDSLRGKKVVLLHLDGPYGEEPIPLLQAYADSFDFTLLPVPVAAKEMQSQSSQWAKIKSEKPDFVLLWGWGAMNGGALAEAVKSGLAMDRLVGIWWSANDDDLKLVGEAAKGYRALSWNLPALDAEVIKDIRKYVVDAGKSQTPLEALDKVFYQRGVLISMLSAEAIKVAQEHFDKRLINGEQMRWGLENLKLDSDRLAALGMAGMIGPFATSCASHAGNGSAWLLQWDGAKFVRASHPLTADREMIAPLVDQQAGKFAAAHTPWPLNDACKN